MEATLLGNDTRQDIDSLFRSPWGQVNATRIVPTPPSDHEVRDVILDCFHSFVSSMAEASLTACAHVIFGPVVRAATSPGVHLCPQYLVVIRPWDKLLPDKIVCPPFS